MLSLGAVHSFALEEVVRYLSSKTVRDVLTQAVLDAPMFGVYWRWNASTALAVRRFRNGKKQPAQFQRMDAEDLLSTVFPDQLACAENLAGGDREIPDHPLVKQTLEDCLTGAMDVDGARAACSSASRPARSRCMCRELTSPSPLAQEILGAKPYAFLDDAPAEERRTLAVQSRRLHDAGAGRRARQARPRRRSSACAREAWPQVCNADELHDALVLLGFVTACRRRRRGWAELFERLRADGRATTVELAARRHRVGQRRARCRSSCSRCRGAVAAERLAVLGDAPVDARRGAARARAQPASRRSGPSRRKRSRGRSAYARSTCCRRSPRSSSRAPRCAARSRARAGRRPAAPAEEWCERRLLARIHRYTLKRLRNEIEPATLADYQRFLFHWQGLGGERAGKAARRSQRRARRAARLRRCRPRSGSARCCRRASPTTARSCSISYARPARSSGGGRGRAARSRRARATHRGDVADRDRAARRVAAAGGRSARPIARAGDVRRGRARRRRAARRAARRSSSRSCKRAACCACRSRRRSASSSRAAS